MRANQPTKKLIKPLFSKIAIIMTEKTPKNAPEAAGKAPEKVGVKTEPKATEAAGKAVEKPKEASKGDFKSIVRIADKDIDGKLSIYHAMTKSKGVNFMLSNAICKALGLDRTKQAGSFSSKELEKIEGCIRNPTKHGILAL